MRLSSNVIKQVSCELEHCSVYPNKGARVKEPVQQTPIPVTVDLDHIHNEAEQILKNARAEAESILQQAYDRAAEIEKEAFRKGYMKGEQDAAQAGEKARREFQEAAGKILQEIEEIKENIYRDMEGELAELAVAIAEKLVARQLDIKPETVLDIVKAACIQARDCEQVILYVPAEQMDLIKPVQEEIGAILYKTEHFAIIADPDIRSGGCRIETEKGYIDARRETMMEQLTVIFKEDQR